MKRGTLAPYAVASLAAVVSLAFAWQTRAESSLALLLLAGVGAAFAAIALSLRAAPYVLGVLFLLLGLPLLATGGTYSLVVGALLIACGALAPPPPREFPASPRAPVAAPRPKA